MGDGGHAVEEDLQAAREVAAGVDLKDLKEKGKCDTLTKSTVMVMLMK